MVEKLNFKISSGLKDILGRDLITNEFVAVFELVKNSFDANANNILVSINKNKNKIVIKDDGIGMTKSDLVDKWLFVAYSHKAENTNITFAGSKGIGRFSCDRLGSKVSIITKNKGEVQNSILNIDWKKFESNLTEEFKDVEVDYLTNDEDIFRSSGTSIEITDLRDEWDEKKINSVILSLRKLLNPFGKNNTNVQVEFISELGIKIIEEEIKNDVLNKIHKFSTIISCSIKNEFISIKLEDREKVIYSFTAKNNSLLKNVEFNIYYLNEIGKSQFTKIMGMRSIDYGNLFLYKNDFRVFPFGEYSFDAFGLNLRKTQGYNRNLGGRELLGWINIIDSENHFREVSSRDHGFVENRYTQELEDVYMSLIHRPLEDYMQLIKFGSIEVDEGNIDQIRDAEQLLKRFRRRKLEIVEEMVIKELPRTIKTVEEKINLLDNEELSREEKKEIKRSIKENISAVKQENKEVKKENREKDKLVTSIEMENTNIRNILAVSKPEKQDLLFHELNHISNEISSTTRLMKKNIQQNDSEKIEERLYKYFYLAQRLKSIQKQILRTNFSTKDEKININIVDYLSNYIKLSEDDRFEINYLKLESGLIRKINIFDFGILVDNLIQNAKDRDASKLNIYFKDNSLFFESDTKFDADKEKIFNLGYSTKVNGSGIGLYMVKEICKKFDWNITVEINNFRTIFQIKM